jgi:hypothetical protein
MTAREFVGKWLVENKASIGVAPSKWARCDDYTPTFNAWFETEKYAIDICCWDHVNCLDIIVLNLETKKEDFALSGACDGLDGLSRRLWLLIEWLEKNK